MTPLPPLVGLIGHARTGKDTVAGFLIREHGYTRIAFADSLKAAALDIDPVIESTANVEEEDALGEALAQDAAWYRHVRLSEIVGAVGWERAKDVADVRRLLQRLGTAIRDHADRDVWVRGPMAEAARLRAAGTPVVVTDVRFPNEATAIHLAEGTRVRVLRPGAPVIFGATHASETALDTAATDWTISNDGTLDDLRFEVERLVRAISPVRVA
jgi:hypothetical protein